MTRLLWLALGVVAISGCLSGMPENLAPVVSPSELNNAGAGFDNADVTVIGYVVHEREAYGIWDNAEAERSRDAMRCVSLTYGASIRNEVMGANRRMMRLRGTFKRDVTAEGGLFSGLCNFSGVVVTGLEAI